jgi:hypothetical protein
MTAIQSARKRILMEKEETHMSLLLKKRILALSGWLANSPRIVLALEGRAIAGSRVASGLCGGAASISTGRQDRSCLRGHDGCPRHIERRWWLVAGFQ